MSEYSLTILGSSSGLPQAERACAGYLLKCGSSLSLIDCGGGVSSSFLKNGFNPLEVERIFISHTHPDHCCELPLFIQMIYLKGRMKPLDVYVPEEFVEPFNEYLKAVYLIKEKLPFELNVIGYAGEFRFSREFDLTAVANDHLKGYSEYIERLSLSNRMMCFSFEIDVNGKKIIYSSDLSSLDDIKENLSGKDIVLIESTHIDLDLLLSMSKTAGAGKYIITHLGTSDDTREIEQKISASGLDNFVIARDGMQISL